MNIRCNLRLTILLGAAVVWSGINGLARAEESATVPTNPGFNGNTGHINPGSTHPVTSQSKEVTNIPTPEESRQALLEPYSKQPSLGNSPSVPRPEPQTFGGPNANQQSQKKCCWWSTRPYDCRQHSESKCFKGWQTDGVDAFCDRRTPTVRTDRFVWSDDSCQIFQAKRYSRPHAYYGLAVATHRSATYANSRCGDVRYFATGCRR